MMKRRKVNVKRNAARVFPVRLMMLLVFVGVFALVFLWLESRCQSLARELKRAEDQLAEVRRRRVNEEFKWSNLRTYKNVGAALKAFDIVMDWPGKDRLVVLTRSTDILDPQPPAGAQLAQARRREPGE